MPILFELYKPILFAKYLKLYGVRFLNSKAIFIISSNSSFVSKAEFTNILIKFFPSLERRASLFDFIQATIMKLINKGSSFLII